MIFSIFRFFLHPQITDYRFSNSFISAKYCIILINLTSMESLLIQILFIQLNFEKNYPYDWFCGPGSYIYIYIYIYICVCMLFFFSTFIFNFVSLFLLYIIFIIFFIYLIFLFYICFILFYIYDFYFNLIKKKIISLLFNLLILFNLTF